MCAMSLFVGYRGARREHVSVGLAQKREMCNLVRYGIKVEALASCLSKLYPPKSLGRASVAVYYLGSWASHP